MNTKYLRAFMALYEERSISAAAKQLFITPQGLSLTLKKIEAELEGSLFIRHNYGITPTNMACSLYAQASNLINELENIKQKVSFEQCTEKYNLNIASTLGVINYLTIRFIKQYREDHPNVRLTVVENPDRAVKERLLGGEAEIGFLAGPIDAMLFKAIPFTKHRHCLVINETHPLAAKSAISYADLDQEPIALEGRDFMPYQNNLNRFINAHSNPDIIMETTEIVSTHKIAAMNEGIGLSVDFPAWNYPEPGTVIRPFEDLDFTWETFIVYPLHKKISREASEFINYALRWLKKNKSCLIPWPKEYAYLNDWYDEV